MTNSISSDSEFRKEVAEIYGKMAERYGRQAEILKLHAGSINKANEYRPKKVGNKIAKSYNLMAALVGGQRRNEDVIQPSTEDLKYYSGSNVDKAANEKTRKSYELMRRIVGY